MMLQNNISLRNIRYLIIFVKVRNQETLKRFVLRYFNGMNNSITGKGPVTQPGLIVSINDLLDQHHLLDYKITSCR